MADSEDNRFSRTNSDHREPCSGTRKNNRGSKVKNQDSPCDELSELQSRLIIIETQIKIARAKKELSAISAESPKRELLSRKDLEKIKKAKTILKQSIEKEAETIGLMLPPSVDLDRFSQEWVEINWLNGSIDVISQETTLPKTVTDRALRSLLLEGIEIHETREELFEIRRRSSLWQPQFLHALKKKFKNSRDRLLIDKYERSIKECADDNKKQEIELKKKEVDRKLSNRKKYLDQRRLALKSYAPSRRSAEIRATRIQHRIQQLISSSSFLFTGASAIFMALMLVAGVLKLFSAVQSGLGFSINFTHPNQSENHQELFRALNISISKISNHDGAHNAMSESLTALEIILVAPLPYLLVLGLSRYIKALAFQEKADEFRRELLEFKAFEVALFIAIIAASVVSKALSGNLDLIFSGSVAMIITVLAAYYYIIERAAKEAAEYESTHEDK